MENRSNTVPFVIGHRGAAGLAPENTIASLRRAKIEGASWVEFDVMLSACGVPVVIHDHSLDRTTDGHGLVAKTSLSDILSLDAGVWFSDKYRGEKVPELSAVLERLSALNIRPNIELKPTTGMEEETARAVLSTVESVWPHSLPKPLYSSFNYQCLQVMRELSRDAMLGLVLNFAEGWQAKADALACVSVHLNHRCISAKTASEIKSSGRMLLAFTVNNQKRAEKLFRLGVDAVFSDYPDLLS